MEACIDHLCLLTYILVIIITWYFLQFLYKEPGMTKCEETGYPDIMT